MNHLAYGLDFSTQYGPVEHDDFLPKEQHNNSPIECPHCTLSAEWDADNEEYWCDNCDRRAA